jgi:iron complex transport system substrate-binding protein
MIEQRIASLLPGATEIVLALGLRRSLVAVSHSCDFPGRTAALPRVTRTSIPFDLPSEEIDRRVRAALDRGDSLYEVDGAALEQLAPDLIITQGLCRVCAVVPEQVACVTPALPGNPSVLSLAPRTLGETLDAIRQVGEATGRECRAGRVIDALRRRVESVRAQTRQRPRPRVAFLEWLDPPICGGHWNPELVELAGGEDILGRAGEPSRTTTWSEITDRRPDVMVVACCGYPAERSRAELAMIAGRPEIAALPCVRDGRVHVVDGKALFSRPGPSLVSSLELLATLIDSAPSLTRPRAPAS